MLVELCPRAHTPSLPLLGPHLEAFVAWLVARGYPHLYICPAFKCGCRDLRGACVDAGFVGSKSCAISSFSAPLLGTCVTTCSCQLLFARSRATSPENGLLAPPKIHPANS
jgi:hypothetical protein